MIFTHVKVGSWARSLWAGVAGGIVLGLFGGVALILAVGGTPPVTMREVREVDGFVVRGGRLDFFCTIGRARFCSVATSCFLWQWTEVDGERARQVVPLGMMSGDLTPTGDGKRVVLSLLVPADLPEGEWFY